MRKIKTLTVSLIVMVSLFMAGFSVAATRNSRPVTVSPSTLVLTQYNQGDLIWAVDLSNKVESGDASWFESDTPEVSAKTTAYPVSRLNAFSATLNIPDGSFISSENPAAFCVLELVMRENPDTLGFNYGGWTQSFLIESFSAAIQQPVSIVGLSEYTASAVQIKIQFRLTCYDGDWETTMVPDTFPSFSIGNVRWIMTTFA